MCASPPLQAEDDEVKWQDFTEWNIDAIQEENQLAHKRKCNALVQKWGSGQIKKYYGTIEEINIHNQSIIISDLFGDVLIPLKDIISVQSGD